MPANEDFNAPSTASLSAMVLPSSGKQSLTPLATGLFEATQHFTADTGALSLPQPLVRHRQAAAGHWQGRRRLQG
jgi:hypothetical protein